MTREPGATADPAAVNRPHEVADASDAWLREVLSRTIAAAHAVSSARPGHVYEDLAQALARILGADAALIAEFTDDRRQRMRTLALALEGRLLRTVEYDVAQTPCRHIVGRASRFVSSGVNAEFAPGTIFANQGFDAYAGYSVTDDTGAQRGIIVALGRAPFTDQELIEALLRVFAMRVGAEFERARAESALHASEQNYRAIFEAAEDAIFVHDWDTGRILDVNPKACRAYGWSRDEMLRCSIEDLSSNVPPYTLADALQHFEAARRGQSVRFEWHRRNRDGSLHWDEVVLKPVTIGGAPRILAFTREITERKTALEALLQREEQYRVIFDGSADALVLWDKSIRIVDVNAAFTAMYGYTHDEVVGGSFGVRLSDEEVRQRIALIERGLAGHEGQLETRTMRKNGELFDVELRYLPIEHRGEPHVLAIARDITERRRAEERLRASEARYRLLFDTESDAIVLVDAESLRLVDVNQAALQMYGYTRPQLLALTALDLSTDPDQTRRSIQQPSGAISVPLRWHKRSDGSEFPVEINANRLLLDGRTTVVATIRDITERKRAEQALRASEEQYRTIFNASADALVLWDSQLKRVDVNPAYERIFGWRRDQVIGRRYEDRGVQPQYVERRLDMVRRALAGEMSHAELESVRKNGEHFRAEIHVIPIRHRGEPHVLAIVRDVTERRRAEEERARLEAQLRQAQKMEAIGQLTGGIAHDFNNILASVMGYLVLTEERALDAGDDRSVHYLGEAQASCRRARDLIQQMLTFSRGGRGEPGALSLAALVRELTPMLRSMLPSTLAVEVECDEHVPSVWVDEVQAHQVLLNLAINSRDAMGGTGTLRIGVARRSPADLVCASCRRAFSGPHVELAVADTGAGIAPELLERIFDPFFTTKEPGKGSGMGLSMVHGIVHEHRGHIVVETTPGAGTTFRVLWPVHRDAARATPRAPARGQPRARLRGRVLLVDDERGVLEPMHEMLVGWGLQVAKASSAAEALAIYRSDPDAIDVVVTDHAMPVTTGIELAADLRALDPNLRWLLCTGFADDATQAQAQAHGVCAVLRKPVEPAELRAALEACLATLR